jgi:DNA-binding IclR family transcriptional regulator
MTVSTKTDAGRETREAILNALRDYRHLRGYYPTQEEIQVSLDLSRGSFLWHLNSLVAQGYLSYERGRFARTLRVSRKSRESLQ